MSICRCLEVAENMWQWNLCIDDTIYYKNTYRRFSLFIIRSFGDVAGRPNGKLYIFARRILRGFVPFLAA